MNILRRVALAAAMLLLACPAYAQVQPGGGNVSAKGAITPGDCAEWYSSVQIEDATVACGTAGVTLGGDVSGPAGSNTVNKVNGVAAPTSSTIGDVATFGGTTGGAPGDSGTLLSSLLTSATAASTYAPLASPALTGVPTAPTATGGTNTTQLATTAFVTSAAGSYLPLAGGTGTGSGSFIFPANPFFIGNATAPQTATENLLTKSDINSLSMSQWTNDTAAAQQTCLKSRNTTPGSHTIITSGDNICSYYVYADDGTNYDVVGLLSWNSVGAVTSGVAPPSQAYIQVVNSSNALTTLMAWNGNANKVSTTAAFAASAAVTMPGLASSSASATGTVCWTTSTGNLTVDTTTTCLLSDERDKQDIAGLTIADAFNVMRWDPVSYHYKPEFQGTNDPNLAAEQVGFTAQRMAKVDPRLMSVGPDGEPHSVRYQQMVAVLTKAVQVQQWEIWAMFAWLAGLTYFVVRRPARA